MDDRRDGVEEGERALAGQAGDCRRQRRRGQRSGGDDHAVPRRRRQAGDLAALDGDQRLGLQPGGHRRREALAIDRERAAGGQLVGIAGGHDQRAGAPHLLVQQAYRVGFGVVGAEGVGAHQLRKIFGEVRLGPAHRPHLVQHHRHACGGKLPRGFAAGQSAAHNVNWAQNLRRLDA